jgi:hypothetical protein
VAVRQHHLPDARSVLIIRCYLGRFARLLGRRAGLPSCRAAARTISASLSTAIRQRFRAALSLIDTRARRAVWGGRPRVSIGDSHPISLLGSNALSGHSPDAGVPIPGVFGRSDQDSKSWRITSKRRRSRGVGWKQSATAHQVSCLSRPIGSTSTTGRRQNGLGRPHPLTDAPSIMASERNHSTSLRRIGHADPRLDSRPCQPVS